MNTTKKNISCENSAEESLKSLAKSLKPYKKVMDTLSPSLNTMIKSLSTVPQLKITGVSESLQNTMNMYAKLNMSYLSSDLLSNSLFTSLLEIRKILYNQTYVFESLRGITDSMCFFSKNIASEQLRKLCEIDYSTLFANILPQASSISQIVNNVYSTVQDELSENNEDDENFTEEEIHETLQEQAENPKGFQERIANWTEKKKIQFFIIWQLLSFIYGNFLQPSFQENIGIPVTAYVISNVKELPQKGANIICKLKENIEAIVIENTSYYYKVTFIDENGEYREGYVAKRNLKTIEGNSQKGTK